MNRRIFDESGMKKSAGDSSSAGIQILEKEKYISLVVSTSRPIEIEIENVLSVETNF
jgi:hypothetical protein